MNASLYMWKRRLQAIKIPKLPKLLTNSELIFTITFISVIVGCFGGVMYLVRMQVNPRVATTADFVKAAKDPCMKYNIPRIMDQRDRPMTVRDLDELQESCDNLMALEAQKEFK